MLREHQLLHDKLAFHQRNCELCFQPAFQTACLLKPLLQNLYSRLLCAKTEKQDPPIMTEYQSLNGSQKNQDELAFKNGFCRLISQTFDSQFKHSKQYRNCNHKQIEKIFSAKLECDQKMLDKISDDAVFQIAQRNFQLQTLIFQIRSFPKTIEQACQAKFRKQSEPKNSNAENAEQKEFTSELKYQQPQSDIKNKRTRKAKKIRKKTTVKNSLNKEDANEPIISRDINLNAQKQMIRQQQLLNVKRQQPMVHQEIKDARNQAVNPQIAQTFNAQLYAFAHMLPLFYNHHQNY